jgi:hypothetical protein
MTLAYFRPGIRATDGPPVQHRRGAIGRYGHSNGIVFYRNVHEAGLVVGISKPVLAGTEEGVRVLLVAFPRFHRERHNATKPFTAYLRTFEKNA